VSGQRWRTLRVADLEKRLRPEQGTPIELPADAKWAVLVPPGAPNSLVDLVWLGEIGMRMPGRLRCATTPDGRVYAGTEHTPLRDGLAAAAHGQLAAWRAEHGAELEKRYPPVAPALKGLWL